MVIEEVAISKPPSVGEEERLRVASRPLDVIDIVIIPQETLPGVSEQRVNMLTPLEADFKTSRF